MKKIFRTSVGQFRGVLTSGFKLVDWKKTEGDKSPPEKGAVIA